MKQVNTAQIHIDQIQIQRIRDAADAINVITRLLIEFEVDSDCGNEIPEKIKNRYVGGGLLSALKIAGEAIEADIDWIEIQHERLICAAAKQTETDQA